MKGPHDDKLTWPLRGECEVKLLNQISECEYYSAAVPYMVLIYSPGYANW